VTRSIIAGKHGRTRDSSNSSSRLRRRSLPKEPPNTIRLVAYRIAQEAILNVRKHSRARNVSIRFETSEGGLLVTIQDDGVGFDPSKPDPIPLGNRGLNSMRDRAEAAGGLTVVDSLPGHGTTVRLWLPM
jgi:signal transduction histidine kinase